MTNSSLKPDPQELAFLRETVDKLAIQELLPNLPNWESLGAIPSETWQKLGSMGLLCTDVPETMGGFGATPYHAAAVIEQLGHQGLTSLQCNLIVHSDIVAHYLVNYGTPAQQQTYLPGMVSGECIGAIAMTEPNAGSDLQNIKSFAEDKGDYFIINGSKTFITNGQQAGLVIVAAKTDRAAKGSRGISLFLIPGNAEGLIRGRKLEKIGLHACDTSELFFENIRVPKNALLGQLHQGFKILMTELPRERLMLGVGCVGAMKGALNWTIEYVKERQAFGQAIANFQNTRFTLAELDTEYKMAKAFLDQCLEDFSTQKLDSATASQAKLAASEVQGKVIDRCLQLFGGYGYMMEYPIARAYLDARVQRIYGGTSEIMKELIARNLLQ